LPEWISSAFGFAILKRSLVKTSNKGAFTKEDIAAYKKAWQQPGALTAMINWYRAHKYNKAANHHLIQLPVLLIWGENDAFLMTKMAAESINKCKNGKLEIIKGATHWVHHEQPQLVNKLIYDFVTKQ
jgi:pimeloyl-ACP methyl ester carboxylesterase